MKQTIVLITGGSCSGKSEMTTFFRNALVVDMDRFYKKLTDIPKDKDGNLNFDTPEAVDIAECAQAVKMLMKTGSVKMPLYDMKKNDRVGWETIKVKKTDKFIIVEGLFAFYEPLRSLGDIKIFLNTPAEMRIARRMLRDIKRKGNLNYEDTLKAFIAAERGYKKYVQTMHQYADVTIPFSFNPLQLNQ
ncbi:hypothetical protein A3F03_00585 [Candidatus Roizmanbacteria bacterium RIFCSPHIGHO2_12_FULL_41_11]|uniref:Phosphoribulokinase/uridine kinase domain-containing protein n=3 Tax=Candidatus Roizmaniibacteriota TaxID=1752723 RepID=A0A1F7JS21_9BACT|nr:MAG: hypothetical protein A3F03_00585 [Candidatus Roizmanbacteria bacterium RIFCSPHIGHO2_12_FULL_41_11]OGK51595.1 MAG: hypothetical protein A2966_02990 [Candidatus Roizmanbacteria bacterium RIFCSPLOWO2_01_FULL_41_22]OGK58403.1 MAG: hypothetical protein A3H86_03155 [Candidatus Roizmanbacteria bacterium RIFCSPLOWO2_02_FULL_41_9]